MKASDSDIKKLVDMDYEQAVEFLSIKYSADRDVASKVLQKSISYLTREHKEEIDKLKEDIESLNNDQSDIYEFLIKKYKFIRKEIKKQIDKQMAENS
jgi:septal ring factor EnvC (AmiA/AmiB activator)